MTLYSLVMRVWSMKLGLNKSNKSQTGMLIGKKTTMISFLFHDIGLLTKWSKNPPRDHFSNLMTEMISKSKTSKLFQFEENKILSISPLNKFICGDY